MLDRITFIDRIILSTIENEYQVAVPIARAKSVFLFQNYLYNPLYGLGFSDKYDDRKGFLG
jgi:hypothetical protein